MQKTDKRKYLLSYLNHSKISSRLKNKMIILLEKVQENDCIRSLSSALQEVSSSMDLTRGGTIRSSARETQTCDHTIVGDTLTIVVAIGGCTACANITSGAWESSCTCALAIANSWSVGGHTSTAVLARTTCTEGLLGSASWTREAWNAVALQGIQGWIDNASSAVLAKVDSSWTWDWCQCRGGNSCCDNISWWYITVYTSVAIDTGACSNIIRELWANTTFRIFNKII